ncbi:MAG: UDP-glucose dehydrogenase family protein [Planctomycetota bacterium]|jgi:UDPglucose 6-dehydrogenase
MKVTVIGVGYVGLVTAAALARWGHEVVAADIDEGRIGRLNAGEVPIYEPGLDELLAGEVAAGRIRYSTDVPGSVVDRDVVMICVGTPPDATGRADLSYVASAARTIAENLTGYTVVVEKSTVPVRTGDRVSRTMEHHVRDGVEFDVASNPEFLREGCAVADALNPDRIVIGVPSERAGEVMRELYGSLQCPIIVTDVASAELIKHASNSFLATKISFINAVSRICELSGADVEQVAQGMGLDSRIGPKFLRAGVGYGGSCFGKDLDAFAEIASELGYEFGLLREVQAINKAQRLHLIHLLRQEMWVLKGKRVCLLGLAFKPDTDDVRDAPALTIARRLIEEGATVVGYDPKGAEGAKAIIPELELAPDAYAAAEGADGLILVTEWPEFADIDFAKLKGLMRVGIVVDGRNFWDPAAAHAAGLTYKSMGRPDPA